MLKSEHIFTSNLPKQIFCFLLLFLFFSTQSSIQAENPSFILEKTTESEKEESKTEEEQLETQENLNYSIQKAKKGKNISLDSFFANTFANTFLQFGFVHCSHHSGYSGQAPFLFAATPRYLFFGSLLFYEG